MGPSVSQSLLHPTHSISKRLFCSRDSTIDSDQTRIRRLLIVDVELAALGDPTLATARLTANAGQAKVDGVMIPSERCNAAMRRATHTSRVVALREIATKIADEGVSHAKH